VVARAIEQHVLRGAILAFRTVVKEVVGRSVGRWWYSAQSGALALTVGGFFEFASTE
jgi:hypothetical protein